MARNNSTSHWKTVAQNHSVPAAGRVRDIRPESTLGVCIYGSSLPATFGFIRARKIPGTAKTKISALLKLVSPQRSASVRYSSSNSTDEVRCFYNGLLE